ncbi:MAG: AAA family ATPase [Clostridia bacterium]|nr:AAA family ATPase [Clostridia bacterium]
MSRFYLKELTVSGEGKKPSSVDFVRGLNIIHGVSDTGKTCIIKCIDYVFGNSKDRPLPEKHGYDTITLSIETNNGFVTLKRTIGKNKVAVSSTDVNIASDVY